MAGNSDARRRETRERLRASGPVINPSLLQCDFGHLADEIGAVVRCGAPSVHWDVMDGDFVPNFTYGPPVIASLRSHATLVYDTHLMMSRPEKYLDDFLRAGCDVVTVHCEAVPEPAELLRAIRAGGALAGLAVNPPTPIERIEPWLDEVDVILVMSVMPGFGGQKFDPNALTKLQRARKLARPGTLLEVDGGVNRTTFAAAVAAGADLLVVGSAFFTAPDRRAEYDALKALAPARS